MTRKASLPIWATALGPGRIEIDALQFYPTILEELGVKEIDQYWLEVAFQIAKTDVQTAITGTDLMPPAGGALRIFVKDGSKAGNGGVSKWAQSEHPVGRGTDAATKGREAAEHYRRIRGSLI